MTVFQRSVCGTNRLRRVHCKNRRVVLTQLVYHCCNLSIKNNPNVFACTQFKFQNQPSCFYSACTKHLNCNCGKQVGLKQPSCFCSVATRSVDCLPSFAVQQLQLSSPTQIFTLLPPFYPPRHARQKKYPPSDAIYKEAKL